MDEKLNPVVNFTMKDNKVEDPVYFRIYDEKEMTVALHTHEMLQINYVLKGNLIHLINGNEIVVKEGDAFIIPPHIPHKISMIENNSFTMVELEFNEDFAAVNELQSERFESYVDFTYIEPFLVSENKVRPRLNIPIRSRNRIESVLFEIADEYQRRDEGYLLAIRSLVLYLLVHLGRLYSKEIDEFGDKNLFKLHHRNISRALSFIDDNYMRRLTVDEVARHANLSKSHFCYVCRSLTGKTFSQYLTEKRIEKVCSRLVSKNDLVSSVATECGFRSVAHFNRVFRKSLNMSPKEYRAAYGRK